jgi:O-antigen ligase
VALFVAWRERRRWALACNGFALGLSQSRGAMLAAVAGLAVLLWHRSRYLAVACAAIAPIGVVLIQHSANEARLEVWRLGLQVATQRPLTGWGIGGIEPLTVIDQRLMTLGHFYSVPLDWLVATGALGLAAAAWVAIEAWRLAGKEVVQTDPARPDAPFDAWPPSFEAGASRAILEAWRVAGRQQAAGERLAGAGLGASTIEDGHRREHQAILAAWLGAGLFLSASWPMWLVLFAVLADLVGRDVPDRADAIHDHQPLLNGGVRALRPE